MSIRGRTKNIAIAPVGYRQLEGEETFTPFHIELRNGQLTDAGNWIKRPGYTEKWDTVDNHVIDLLVPVNTGYAINSQKQVYKLSSTSGTVTELTGTKLTGTSRPIFAEHNNIIILCNGGQPTKINSSNIMSLLSGSPPDARFAARISSYLILSGHDNTEFKWSAAGNPENFTTGDSGFANVQKAGGIIINMLALREKLYFFKSNSIEVWIFLGGSTPFVRQDALWIDKGVVAGDSVVQANNTFYFFGDDHDFYVIDGGQPKVISKSYRKQLNTLVEPSKVYGFDFRQEGIIRWFAPTEGRCFVYDYTKGNFSEDNRWNNGQWERLPINSYMELNNIQYIGDFEPTGKIYTWSRDTKDDNGQPIRVFRKFAFLPSEGGRQVRFNRLRFRFKRGIGVPDSNPQLIFRYRLDQGDFTNFQFINMNEHGNRNPWTDLYNLGIGREIEVEIIETDAVEFLLTHMNVTFKELGR